MTTRSDLITLFSHRLFACRFDSSGIGVEVGVLNGDFSAEILQRWGGQLVLVDPWRQVSAYKYKEDMEQCYAKVCARFAGEPRVRIVRECSVPAAATFADGSLDWVYLDADHALEAVTADIAAWWRKVKPGGVLCGHDYFEAEGFGVKRAVDTFVLFKGLRLELTADWPPSWAVAKPM